MIDNLETLNEFQLRTNSFNQTSLPINNIIETNPGLENKVSPDGHFTEFYGSTTVFNLPENVKNKISCIQKILYENCSDVLAEPLKENTFHITLHDLINGKPSDELEQKILSTQPDALRLIKDISKQTDCIHLRSTFLFNMVNTSMVLGFEPADEKSCCVLMSYYELLQNVVKLNYKLTPHVTIAYFKPRKIDKNYVEKLQYVIDFVKSQPPINVELYGTALEYQKFTDMNNYYNIV